MATIESPLSLRLNNPYSNGEIFTFDEGDKVLDGNEFDYVKSIKDRYFTVEQGDTLQSISFEAYGDSKYYWVIQKVNNMDESFTLEVGSSLLIPDNDSIKTTNNQ